jgi:TonB family protein
MKATSLLCVTLLSCLGCAPPSSTNAPPRKKLITGSYEISSPEVKVKPLPSAPPYPSQARVSRVQGDVVLEVTINEEGKPINVRAIDGPKELIPTAENYLAQFRFFPVIENGRPIKKSFLFTMPFRLR